MQPSETFKMTHDMADDRRDAMSQLSEAQARAEADLLGGRDAALAEGVRRAEAVLFAAGEPLSAEQVAEILPQGIEAGEVLMALRAVYSKRGVNLVEVAGKWRFQTRIVRLWDGAVLKNFPGRGEWVPRKRPDSLIIKR